MYKRQVIYVSQSVFDSYTTSDALSSIAQVNAFVASMRSSSASPPASPPATTISNGDVIALIGTGDLYAVHINGESRMKRHFTNFATFQAYQLRDMSNVIYVSQSVFDSYTTGNSLSSVADVQALVSSIRTGTGTPTGTGTGTATPTTPPTSTPTTPPTSTPTTATPIIDTTAILAQITAAGDAQVARINQQADTRIREIESTEGETRVVRTTSSIDNRQIERIYERINEGDKKEIDNVLRSVSAKVGTPPQTSIDVSWSAVEGNNVSYEVRAGSTANPANIQWTTATTTDTTHSLTGLEPNTHHWVEVRAIVDGKHGAWKKSFSYVTTAIREYTVNLARITPTIEPTNTGVTISWDAVVPKGSNKDADDVEYRIVYRVINTPALPQTIITTSNTSRVITGLNPGSLHDFTMRAETPLFRGTYSLNQRVQTTFVDIPKPTNVRIVQQDRTKLIVQWDVDQTLEIDKKEAPVLYDVEHSTDGSTWTAAGTGYDLNNVNNWCAWRDFTHSSTNTGRICVRHNEARISGLTANTKYQIRVRAKSPHAHTGGSPAVYWYSEWSDVLTTITYAEVLAEESKTDTTVTLTWGFHGTSATNTGNGEIQYCVGGLTDASCNEDSEFTTSTETTAVDSNVRRHILTGLTPSTDYVIRLKATYSDGTAGWYYRKSTTADPS